MSGKVTNEVACRIAKISKAFDSLQDGFQYLLKGGSCATLWCRNLDN